MVDGKRQILFIENVNTYQPHEVSLEYSRCTKLPFISLSPQKGGKLIMITILKSLEPPIVSRTILDTAKQTTWYLWFQNPFTSSLFTPLNGISSPKNDPYPGISQLRNAFEKCKHELIFEVLWHLIVIVTWFNESLVLWNL